MIVVVIRINGGKEKIAIAKIKEDLSKKGLILANFSSIVSGTFLGLGHKAYAEEWLNITVSNGEDER